MKQPAALGLKEGISHTYGKTSVKWLFYNIDHLSSF